MKMLACCTPFTRIMSSLTPSGIALEIHAVVQEAGIKERRQVRRAIVEQLQQFEAVDPEAGMDAIKKSRRAVEEGKQAFQALQKEASSIKASVQDASVDVQALSIKVKDSKQACRGEYLPFLPCYKASASCVCICLSCSRERLCVCKSS